MIRRATRDDSEEVRVIMEQMEWHTFDPKEFREFYWKALEDDRYLMWVYEADGKAVGFISLLIKTPIHHIRTTGEVVELAVHEDYRNRGIGSELLLYLHDYAREHDLSEVELNSKKIRLDAHRFYFRHRYEDLRNNLTFEFDKGAEHD